MANEEHLEILKQGVEVWNRWRKENPDLRPELSAANLRLAELSAADLRGAGFSGVKLFKVDPSGAKLSEADLSRTDLSRTDLSEADLHEVHLGGANLSDANLRDANLRGANLSDADLGGASLSGAHLSGAHLSGAHLGGASLSGAHLSGANLNGANLSRADLSSTDLSGRDLSGVNLSGANLNQTVLIGTDFSNANLSNCSVYGIAAWNLNLEGATQSNLVITPPDEPNITVDNLEVAQFIYLLLHNEKIRHIIDTITSKVVLILGRFTPERKAILDAIRDELRRRDYLPILFDFEKPGSRDLTETVSTLAHMARFVIADITDAKSIPAELERIVPGLPSVPVQPLIASSDDEYGMFEHFRRYPWVLDTYQYDSLENLLSSLREKVIDPAELKAKELTSPTGRALVSAPPENPKAPTP
jgi:uncharacterized protein YjbI with pentapeptide repeats